MKNQAIDNKELILALEELEKEKEIIKEYLLENKKIVLEGFVNFRIKEYKELLEKIVEVSVFSYLDLITF